MRWPMLLVVLAVAACTEAGQPAQRQIAVPDWMLGYSYGGGTVRPIANTQTGIVDGRELQSAY